jgi:hypothetical protein
MTNIPSESDLGAWLESPCGARDTLQYNFGKNLFAWDNTVVNVYSPDLSYIPYTTSNLRPINATDACIAPWNATYYYDVRSYNQDATSLYYLKLSEVNMFNTRLEFREYIKATGALVHNLDIELSYEIIHIHSILGWGISPNGQEIWVYCGLLIYKFSKNGTFLYIEHFYISEYLYETSYVTCISLGQNRWFHITGRTARNYDPISYRIYNSNGQFIFKYPRYQHNFGHIYAPNYNKIGGNIVSDLGLILYPNSTYKLCRRFQDPHVILDNWLVQRAITRHTPLAFHSICWNPSTDEIKYFDGEPMFGYSGDKLVTYSGIKFNGVIYVPGRYKIHQL